MEPELKERPLDLKSCTPFSEGMGRKKDSGRRGIFQRPSAL